MAAVLTTGVADSADKGEVMLRSGVAAACFGSLGVIVKRAVSVEASVAAVTGEACLDGVFPTTGVGTITGNAPFEGKARSARDDFSNAAQLSAGRDSGDPLPWAYCAGRVGTSGVCGVRSPFGHVPVNGVVTNGVVITFHQPCERLGVGTSEVSTTNDVSIVLSRRGVSSSSKKVSLDMTRFFRCVSSSYSSKAVSLESRVPFLLCVGESGLDLTLVCLAEVPTRPSGRAGTGGIL